MSSEINIQMKQYNGTDYDNLYPKTKGELVSGIYTEEQTLSLPTKQLYGLDSTATPDDAFNMLILATENKSKLVLTIQTTNGNPISGVAIPNLLDGNGSPVKTDSNGVANGYVQAGTFNISIKDYGDIQDYNESIQITSGRIIKKIIKVSTRNFLKLTSSKSIKFSGNVNRLDITAVGGGGGGTNPSTVYEGNLGMSGSGGGGGYCTVSESVSFIPNTLYKAEVGSGGQTEGANGGSSSFINIVAKGGGGGTPGQAYEPIRNPIGGIGNPNGANGQVGNRQTFFKGIDGKPGAVHGYSSFTETVLYGGSGGGGALDNYGNEYPNGGVGGGYGGKGGSAPRNAVEGTQHGVSGTDGFGGGGGGAGCFITNRNPVIGKFGKGGSGCIAIRMHLKQS